MCERNVQCESIENVINENGEAMLLAHVREWFRQSSSSMQFTTTANVYAIFRPSDELSHLSLAPLSPAHSPRSHLDARANKTRRRN